MLQESTQLEAGAGRGLVVKEEVLSGSFFQEYCGQFRGRALYIPAPPRCNVYQPQNLCRRTTTSFSLEPFTSTQSPVLFTHCFLRSAISSLASQQAFPPPMHQQASHSGCRRLHRLGHDISLLIPKKQGLQSSALSLPALHAQSFPSSCMGGYIEVW